MCYEEVRRDLPEAGVPTYSAYRFLVMISPSFTSVPFGRVSCADRKERKGARIPLGAKSFAHVGSLIRNVSPLSETVEFMYRTKSSVTRSDKQSLSHVLARMG